MKDVVFTTYSFGELYCYQQDRLKESILKIYPEANVLFWRDCDGNSAGPQLGRPPGSPTFHESIFGFKTHCVRNCLEAGYKKIIFLDAAMILEGLIDNTMEMAHKVGVLAAIDESQLQNYISDACLRHVGMTREEIKLIGLTLVCGSMYVFDFTSEKTQAIWEYWHDMERDGMFGCQEDDCRGLLQGHRMDETCMALALHANGSRPYGFDEVGYRNINGGQPEDRQEGFTFYKLHFRGIGQIHDHSFNQTMMPLHGNVLDLGCRDFVFADFFKSQEYNVHAVDIDDFPGEYHRLAISSNSGTCRIVRGDDPDATHISSGEGDEEINTMTIEEFSSMVGIDHWHLIKMDIEGSEYDILNTAKHPIADQLSVEFHCHSTSQTKESLDVLLDMLSEYYYIHGRDWLNKHGAGYNYWDVLLIAKGKREKWKI